MINRPYKALLSLLSLVTWSSCVCLRHDSRLLLRAADYCCCANLDPPCVCMHTSREAALCFLAQRAKNGHELTVQPRGGLGFGRSSATTISSSDHRSTAVG